MRRVAASKNLPFSLLTICILSSIQTSVAWSADYEKILRNPIVVGLVPNGEPKITLDEAPAQAIDKIVSEKPLTVRLQRTYSLTFEQEFCNLTSANQMLQVVVQLPKGIFSGQQIDSHILTENLFNRQPLTAASVARFRAELDAERDRIAKDAYNLWWKNVDYAKNARALQLLQSPPSAGDLAVIDALKQDKELLAVAADARKQARELSAKEIELSEEMTKIFKSADYVPAAASEPGYDREKYLHELSDKAQAMQSQWQTLYGNGFIDILERIRARAGLSPAQSNALAELDQHYRTFLELRESISKNREEIEKKYNDSEVARLAAADQFYLRIEAIVDRLGDYQNGKVSLEGPVHDAETYLDFYRRNPEAFLGLASLDELYRFMKAYLDKTPVLPTNRESQISLAQAHVLSDDVLEFNRVMNLIKKRALELEGLITLLPEEFASTDLEPAAWAAGYPGRPQSCSTLKGKGEFTGTLTGTVGKASISAGIEFDDFSKLAWTLSHDGKDVPWGTHTNKIVTEALLDQIDATKLLDRQFEKAKLDRKLRAEEIKALEQSILNEGATK